MRTSYKIKENFTINLPELECIQLESSTNLEDLVRKFYNAIKYSIAMPRYNRRHDRKAHRRIDSTVLYHIIVTSGALSNPKDVLPKSVARMVRRFEENTPSNGPEVLLLRGSMVDRNGRKIK